MRKTLVAVVVVGEIARSPRILHHVRQLSAEGIGTLVFGFANQPPALPETVQLHPLRALSRMAEGTSGPVFLIGSGIRMMLVFLRLTARLIRARPSHILMQNPPSFPTLASAWIASRAGGARLIVDWHNYGYSMLALRLGSGHLFVRLAAAYEKWMARKAHRHLCVSQAMANDLGLRFRIAAEVLYDTPLHREPPGPIPAEDAPIVVVAPCGWTADERVDLLLDTLAVLIRHPLHHRFRFHLTGDGPSRPALEPRIADLRHAGLFVHTGFLSEPDYRALIHGATVGVSLHESASGLDLAMKNVDLLAAHVPVCALDYGGCLTEQIRDGENGFLFRTAHDLACLLLSFVTDPGRLQRLRLAMRRRPVNTWAEEWSRAALPLFTE